MPFDAAIAPTPSIFVPGRPPASTPRDGEDKRFADLLQRKLNTPDERSAPRAANEGESDAQGAAQRAQQAAAWQASAAMPSGFLNKADANSKTSTTDGKLSDAEVGIDAVDSPLDQAQATRSADDTSDPKATLNTPGSDVLAKPDPSPSSALPGLINVATPNATANAVNLAGDAPGDPGQAAGRGSAVGASNLGAACATGPGSGMWSLTSDGAISGSSIDRVNSSTSTQAALRTDLSTSGANSPRMLATASSARGSMGAGQIAGEAAEHASQGAPEAASGSLLAGFGATDAAATVGADAARMGSIAQSLAGWMGSQAQPAANETGSRDKHSDATDALVGLASALPAEQASTSTAPSTPATTLGQPVPVQSPEFAQALGQQVSVLVSKGIQHASLRLNPAELGPVSVQITLDGQQAQVHFGADSAITRSVLEASMPQLASAMSDAGFTLTGGGVSQHGGSGADSSSANSSGSPQGPNRGGANSESGRAESSGSDRIRVQRTRVRAGGVDTYA